MQDETFPVIQIVKNLTALLAMWISAFPDIESEKIEPLLQTLAAMMIGKNGGSGFYRQPCLSLWSKYELVKLGHIALKDCFLNFQRAINTKLKKFYTDKLLTKINPENIYRHNTHV